MVFVMRCLSGLWCLAQAIAFSSASFAQQPASAGALTIDEICVQLFLEDRGKLGEDLVRTKPKLWNTIIGGGDAGGPANAFLISVFIIGKSALADAVVVTVTSETTKRTIVTRRFSKLIFSPDEGGRAVKPIFVENQVCSPIRVTARTRTREKTVLIPFECGE